MLGKWKEGGPEYSRGKGHPHVTAAPVARPLMRGRLWTTCSSLCLRESLGNLPGALDLVAVQVD